MDEQTVLLMMTFAVGCSFGALSAFALMKYGDTKNTNEAKKAGTTSPMTTQRTSEFTPLSEKIAVGMTKSCEKYHSLAHPCKALIDLRSRSVVREFTPCALCWKTQ